MNLTIKSFIVIFALLCLTNCKDNSTNPAENSIGIIPLKAGNYWIYESKDLDSSGIVHKISYDTVKIISRVNLSGSIYYFSGDNRFLFNSSDGLYLKDTSDLSFQYLIYKYPAKVGDKFQSVNMSDSVTVESLNTEYTCPRGKFSCYVYNTGNYLYEYLSPNIGLIADLEYGTTDFGNKYLSSKMELIEYHLN